MSTFSLVVIHSLTTNAIKNYKLVLCLAPEKNIKKFHDRLLYHSRQENYSDHKVMNTAVFLSVNCVQLAGNFSATMHATLHTSDVR